VFDGVSWGDDGDKIFDNTGIQVGWRPLTQFDLSYEDDYYHCVKNPQIGNCDQLILSSGQSDTYRGMDISGTDPIAPWFFVGNNTGMANEISEDTNNSCYDIEDPDECNYTKLCNPTYPENEFKCVPLCGMYFDSSINDSLSRCGEDCTKDFDLDGTNECYYYYVDTNVLNGIEYTYSVVSYDMGLPDSTQIDANPDSWARPNGYQYIESSRGSTPLDSNFKTVIPGAQNTGNDCNSVRVIPNPYFGRSALNENVYNRRISFMDLPEKYTLSIYTVSGELVWSQNAIPSPAS
jgi:hypothetical protein